MFESPMLPRSGAAVPEVFQILPIANRVHRVPKAGMPVGVQLTVLHQAFHRLTLQDGGVVGEEIEYVRFEDEKAAVDPAGAGGRLLGERADLVAVEIEAAEAGGGMHGGDGGEPAVTPMKRHQVADVDVRQAVA